MSQDRKEAKQINKTMKKLEKLNAKNYKLFITAILCYDKGIDVTEHEMDDLHAIYNESLKYDNSLFNEEVNEDLDNLKQGEHKSLFNTSGRK